MVNKRCFISNCPSGNDKENAGVSMFCIPQGKFEQWQEILQHKPGLTKNSRLCHRHFLEEDIVKGRIISGKFYANQKWRLKKEANPSLHLGCFYKF